MSTALTLSSGATAGSLVVAPRSFGEVLEFSDVMSKCSFVPKHLRGRPGDCLAVVMQALRWEMDPFSVAQKTYFITDGAAPGYEAQLINAVILSRAPLRGRPKVEWSGSGNDLTCTVSGSFVGDNEPKTKTCRIAAIKVRNSPLWNSDPEQQLAYYTTRAWARLYCPDVIMGVYTPDEIEHIGVENERDIAPQQHVSRLDALAEKITNESAPTGDADAGRGGDLAPTVPPAGVIKLVDPETNEEKTLSRISEWCSAIKEMLTKALDPHAAWDANSPQFTALFQSARDRRSREALESAQQTYRELCNSQNAS